MNDPKPSMASRGREAMKAQFKEFYRERNMEIVEAKVSRDYFALMAMFAEWLEAKANRVAIPLSEKGRNIVMAKSMRDWDAWVAIVDGSAEDMVFETFRLPTIPTPSPTGEGRKEGEL